MSIAKKFEVIADEVYEKGKKDEYDKFWDVFQNMGKRTNYKYGFAGHGWNSDNFYPKYDIVVTSGTNMFQEFNGQEIKMFDLNERLNQLGIKFDTSAVANFDYMFYAIRTYSIPSINTKNATRLRCVYQNARKVKTIGTLILKDDGSQEFIDCFSNCGALENFTIEGTIGQNGFNVQWSTKLSGASIVSIIEALSTTTSGLTVTLSQTAVNNMVFPIVGNKGTYNSWTDLEQSRTNWTISLL